jgi:hypothetical protein
MMSEPVLYRAYNLTIASCLDGLPLLLGYGNPDLVIQYGDVPDELPHATTRTPYFHAAPGEAILYIPNVAKYWIQDGHSITIQRHSDVSDEQVCTFLLGSAFGALLHQRGLLVLHGSAIARSLTESIDTGAILFLGRSGAGKSTLAAAFQQQGYAVMTDDICAIAVQDTLSYLYPGYPHIKLKQDACEKLGYAPEDYPRLNDYDDLKYRLSPKHTIPAQPICVKKIYVLVPSSHRQISLKPVEGAAQFAELSRQTYRLTLLNGMGYSKQHFQHCAQIANQVPIVRAIRPSHGFFLQELVSGIQADLDTHA